MKSLSFEDVQDILIAKLEQGKIGGGSLERFHNDICASRIPTPRRVLSYHDADAEFVFIQCWRVEAEPPEDVWWTYAGTLPCDLHNREAVNNLVRKLEKEKARNIKVTEIPVPGESNE